MKERKEFSASARHVENGVCSLGLVGQCLDSVTTLLISISFADPVRLEDRAIQDRRS
jgi:hypothetical protein